MDFAHSGRPSLIIKHYSVLYLAPFIGKKLCAIGYAKVRFKKANREKTISSSIRTSPKWVCHQTRVEATASDGHGERRAVFVLELDKMHAFFTRHV